MKIERRREATTIYYQDEKATCSEERESEVRRGSKDAMMKWRSRRSCEDELRLGRAAGNVQEGFGDYPEIPGVAANWGEPPN